MEPDPQQCSDLTLSASAKAAAPAPVAAARPFPKLPEELELGQLESTILLGIDRWAEMSVAGKEEMVRYGL